MQQLFFGKKSSNLVIFVNGDTQLGKNYNNDFHKEQTTSGFYF